MSLQSYRTAQNQTEDPRQTEYRLLADVTRRLMEVESMENDGYFEALDRNRRVWLTMQMDLVSETNQLPDQLKAELVSLSIWVDKHTSLALRGEAPLEPLVLVNRTIMQGLGGASM